MKSRALPLILGCLALLLAACSPMEKTPEAALAVAQEFLQARSTDDAAALHALLTAPAQEAISRATVARYLEGEEIAFRSLGTPVEPRPDWLQVPVYNLTITGPGKRVRWPDVLLTLHYDGARWRVAWADPLMYRAHQAYDNGEFAEALRLGRTIAAIDPFHYRGYLEQHFAYRGMNRPREAEWALLRAMEAATPYQEPDVHDAWARFKLALGHPEDGLTHAQAALDKAAPYIPFLYSRRWQVDTMVVKGRCLLALGDREGAEALVQEALKLDPENGPLAIFRHQLDE